MACGGMKSVVRGEGGEAKGGGCEKSEAVFFMKAEVMPLSLSGHRHEEYCSSGVHVCAV